MKIEHVFSEYRRGYWKALADAKSTLERLTPFWYTPSGKKKNIFSRKGMISFMNFLLENADDFRTYGGMIDFYAGCDEKGNFYFKKEKQHD